MTPEQIAARMPMPFSDSQGRCDYCGAATRHPAEWELMCDECATADESGRLLEHLTRPVVCKDNNIKGEQC